jgi:hypothetical protein
VPAYLRCRLNDAYDRFLESAPGNRYATADERGWHLPADPTEKLDPVSERQLNELKECAAGRGTESLTQSREVRRDTSGPSDLPEGESRRGKEPIGEAGKARRRLRSCPARPAR